MKTLLNAIRGITLRQLAVYATAALLAKVFVSILLEYRWYFPANFQDAAFLIGRREFFEGVYSAAFYAHIISGPAAILLGSFLMLSGGRSALGRWHAWAGRWLVLVVATVVAPSGLVMAYWAHAGVLASCGFAALAIITAASAIVAGQHARARRLPAHRKWAVRCFILLCSPLLLRLGTGWAIVLGLESELFYALNAWLSWLVPLTVFEVTQHMPARNVVKVASISNLPIAN